MIDKRILLAEDDPSHAELLRRAVEQSGVGCRLDIVHDGVEAIEYLFATGGYADRDPRDPPDLILLDLKMPRMNGLQVLQVLRRTRGHDQRRFSPVVILTGSENDRDIAEAYRLGAQSYICKPLDYPTFASTIRETLEYWLGLNRPVPKHYAETEPVSYEL
jgi:two-component system, response regulator